MLKGIPKVLSPELLKALCEMGHADLIVLGDANFPAKTCAAQSGAALIRADGVNIPELLDAILELMPLDYCEKTVFLMEPDRNVQVPIWQTYRTLVEDHDPRGAGTIEKLERFAYYEKANKAACIVQTGETEIYANIMLQKGVVEEEH